MKSVKVNSYPAVLNHSSHLQLGPVGDVVAVDGHDSVAGLQGGIASRRGVVEHLHDVDVGAEGGAAPDADPDQVGVVLLERHGSRGR